MISLKNKALSTTPEHIIGQFIFSNNFILRIFRIVIMALLTFVSFFWMLLSTLSLTGDSIYKKDFLQVYVLSRAIAEGTNPYLDMPILVSRYVGIISTIFPHPTPYPPSVGIIFLPLSLFSYETAAVIWFIFELVCLLGSLILLFLPVVCHHPFSRIAVLVILALLYWPIHDELQLANINLVLLLILSGMWFSFFKKRQVVTGFLFGISLLIKQIFWPITLIFILGKQWRILIIALITSITGYIVSGLVVGFDKLSMNIFNVIPEITLYYSITPWNISLLSLSTRIFHGLGASADKPVQMSFLSAPPLINNPAVILPFWFALVLLIFVTAYFVLRKIKDMDVLLGIAICISIIVSPMSWGYYLVYLLIPAACIITRLWKEKFPFWKTNIAILVAGFQLITLTKWVDLGIRMAGKPEGLIYAPGANAIPFWPSLSGLMVDIGIVSIIIFLVYLGTHPNKEIQME
jgi:hypothetical protein